MCGTLRALRADKFVGRAVVGYDRVVYDGQWTISASRDSWSARRHVYARELARAHPAIYRKLHSQTDAAQAPY